MTESCASEFVCRRCGACCRWTGHVLLTAEDIASLAAHLGQTETDFIERHAVLARNRRRLSLRERPDGACEFYDADAGCRVYPARPAQCRDFPHGWRVDGCPGLDSSAG